MSPFLALLASSSSAANSVPTMPCTVFYGIQLKADGLWAWLSPNPWAPPWRGNGGWGREQPVTRTADDAETGWRRGQVPLVLGPRIVEGLLRKTP